MRILLWILAMVLALAGCIYLAYFFAFNFMVLNAHTHYGAGFYFGMYCTIFIGIVLIVFLVYCVVRITRQVFG